jgi:hypothetical protein
MQRKAKWTMQNSKVYDVRSPNSVANVFVLPFSNSWSRILLAKRIHDVSNPNGIEKTISLTEITNLSAKKQEVNNHGPYIIKTHNSPRALYLRPNGCSL